MIRNIHTILLGLALILTLSFVGLARETQDNEINSPEMLIKAARFLEQKPFDKQAKDVRSRALTWVIATDKVSVTVCPLFISRIDKKYKYNGEIFGQYNWHGGVQIG